MLRQESSRRDLIAIIELLTALVNSGLETDAVIKEVTERAAFLTGAAGSAVELAEGDAMVYRAVWGAAAGLLGVKAARTGSLSGLCVELGVPLHCPDASTDPRVDRELCDRVGAGSMICVPLSHGAQAVGVLKVFSRERKAFDETHLAMLRLLATVIASSLASAQGFERAEFELYHDALTGLRNRRAYEEELTAEIERARRYDRPLALGLMDINGFRKLNARSGPAGGDELLRRIAGILKRSLRHVDACYRLEADEFAIVLPETGGAEAEMVMRRIMGQIGQRESGVSACAGVAELNGWDRRAQLHRAASEALQEEKRAFYERAAGLVEA